jgi:hypothetical protein
VPDKIRSPFKNIRTKIPGVNFTGILPNLATVYHAFGIDLETIVYNHLNQPRELVKAKPVTTLFA